MKSGNPYTYETGLGILTGMTIAFALVLAAKLLSPILCNLAQEELQSSFNKICGSVVAEYFAGEENDEKELVEIIKNSRGDIQTISANTAEINKFKSEITLKIQNKLDSMDCVKVEVPHGGFFGFGGGIKFPVRLLSVSLLEADIVSYFEGAGINQTRICVDLKISLFGKLLAIGKGNSVKIETKLPLVMDIVVGNIPETYVSVEK